MFNLGLILIGLGIGLLTHRGGTTPRMESLTERLARERVREERGRWA